MRAGSNQVDSTFAGPPKAPSRLGTMATAAAAPRSSDPGSTWMECTAVPRRFVVLRMMYESSVCRDERFQGRSLSDHLHSFSKAAGG